MKIYRICKQHIKDGFIKESINMLSNIKDPVQYLELYIYLSQMIIQMQNSVGPLPHDVYMKFQFLNHPLSKGGVSK